MVSNFTKSLQRPVFFFSHGAEEQFVIDKLLGILDWEGECDHNLAVEDCPECFAKRAAHYKDPAKVVSQTMFHAHIKLRRIHTTTTRLGSHKSHTDVQKFHLVMASSESEVKEKLDKFYKGKEAPANTEFHVIVIDIEEVIA